MKPLKLKDKLFIEFVIELVKFKCEKIKEMKKARNCGLVKAFAR